MKTIFLSFGLLFLLVAAIFSPTNAHAHETKMDIIINQSEINFDHDYPSYAARIKRFHHAEEGLDYFDPRFTTEAMPILRQKKKANKQMISPFEFKNFQYWANSLNSPIIWQYSNDTNYRKLIDKWNHYNNPFWTYGITLSSPFGTFDFTGGVGSDDIQSSEILAQGSIFFSSFRCNKNTVGPNPFIFTSKRNLGNQSSNPPIGLTKLPTRDLQQTIVNNQTVEKPNFTKHVPVAIKWNRGRGTNKGYKRDSNLSQWERNQKNISRANSNSGNSNFSQNYQNSSNINQQYNTLVSDNKSSTISTNSSNNSSSQNHGQKTTKTSTSSTGSNN